MSNPIILKVHRICKTNEKPSGVIRVSNEAENILRQLSTETGLSIKHIASQMILHGAELVEIVEV